MPPLNNTISQIPTEVFSDYIIEKLRRTNPHIGKSFNLSSYVLKGSLLHVPQAGKSPGVTKNRKTFPATATQRVDESILMELPTYYADPVHITWQEENEISYSKTDSVLGDLTATLVEDTADGVLHDWTYYYKKVGNIYQATQIPASKFILTSGKSAAVNLYDTQTGSRKAFTYQELLNAQARMNKENVPMDGRYALIESFQYQQFLESLTTNQMAAYQGTADLKNGIVGRFAGFDILQRSKVLATKSDSTFYEQYEALDSDANLVSLCWQQNSVGEAPGDIVPFQSIQDPLYYGDIHSSLVKYGGMARRAGFEGIIPIVQAAG